MRPAVARVGEAPGDLPGRPGGAAVGMAVGAGVGRAGGREVRPRHPEAVVAPAVDPHVGPLDHVAGTAFGARAAGGVEMVRRIVVGRAAQRRKPRVAGRRMALGADRVALGAQLGRVRIVAVRAADAARVHPRLQERAELVVLVEDLAVRVVKPGPQQREVERVVERRAGQRIAVAERLAPRVAGRALLDLDLPPMRRDRRSGRHPDRRHGRRPARGRPRSRPRSPRARARSSGSRAGSCGCSRWRGTRRSAPPSSCRGRSSGSRRRAARPGRGRADTSAGPRRPRRRRRPGCGRAPARSDTAAAAPGPRRRPPRRPVAPPLRPRPR